MENNLLFQKQWLFCEYICAFKYSGFSFLAGYHRYPDGLDC